MPCSWSLPGLPHETTLVDTLPDFIQAVKALITADSFLARSRRNISADLDDFCSKVSPSGVKGGGDQSISEEKDCASWLRGWKLMGSERHSTIVSEVQVIYYSRETMVSRSLVEETALSLNCVFSIRTVEVPCRDQDCHRNHPKPWSQFEEILIRC
jgi:hypothetical protein